MTNLKQFDTQIESSLSNLRITNNILYEMTLLVFGDQPAITDTPDVEAPADFMAHFESNAGVSTPSKGKAEELTYKLNDLFTTIMINQKLVNELNEFISGAKIVEKKRKEYLDPSDFDRKKFIG